MACRVPPAPPAFADCISDIRFRFGLGLPLAHTPRDRRAFGNIRAVFVPVEADNELHSVSHFSALPYRPEDHRRLAAFLMEPQPFFWVMSYDDVPEIRCLYRGYRQVTFRPGYSARESRLGNEVLISNRAVEFPAGWKRRLPGRTITTACEMAST